MDLSGNIAEWWSPAQRAQGLGSVLSTEGSTRVEVLTWFVLTNLYQLDDLQYKYILLQTQWLNVHNPGAIRGRFF